MLAFSVKSIGNVRNDVTMTKQQSCNSIAQRSEETSKAPPTEVALQHPDASTTILLHTSMGKHTILHVFKHCFVEL